MERYKVFFECVTHSSLYSLEENRLRAVRVSLTLNRVRIGIRSRVRVGFTVSFNVSIRPLGNGA